ncbi:MAG: endopeptidase La, partial [Planctomycetes bacterium]|nr:endopeptidase La [Planctomycetota bacterium]
MRHKSEGKSLHETVYSWVTGSILAIEVLTCKGKGDILLTGRLGPTMQESAKAALSYVKSIADQLSINNDVFSKLNFHIHVPEGAIPKDGPSAGIAIATAIASQLTDRPVRDGIGMTGEITLRGRVLPIGGLKEKLLAALRGGIKTVLIPSDNERDLAEIPDNVKRGLEIIVVSTIDEVLGHALTVQPVPIEWPE